MIGVAALRGVALVLGGGLLTAITMALPLPIFFVFTGAIAVGALYLLLALWYSLRWLVGR
ncbi:MAG: hypothetical protein R3B09_22160 [Nannocystaceae bacterium]